MDDVITSVDQVHMTRIMEMLHDEADNFNQLIITTHYRPWRDRYRYGSGPSSNIQLIELLHWSMPRGIRHTKTKLCADEIEEYLDDGVFDRQIVASKAGILLESILDHFALRYRCRLPRQPEPDYTLGELIDSLPRRFKEIIKIIKFEETNESKEYSLMTILKEITELSWIRNQVGCHFNITGMHVSDTEVKNFGYKTIELANTIICDACGEIPNKNRTGSYWECKCKKTQLHPFSNPF